MRGEPKLIFDAVKALGVVFTRDAAGAAKVQLLDNAIEAYDASIPESAPTPPKPVGPVARPGTFVLSEASKAKMRLGPIHPRLGLCVERAIQLSVVDFRVQEVLRSLANQRAAVNSGNSRTMKSKHFRQSDGYVWAVDLVALVNGKVSWDFPLYGAIAYAMDRAATQLGIDNHIRWGCAWDRVLRDFGHKPEDYMAEAKAYAARHPGKDLMDGPHFEWVN